LPNTFGQSFYKPQQLLVLQLCQPKHEHRDEIECLQAQATHLLLANNDEQQQQRTTQRQQRNVQQHTGSGGGNKAATVKYQGVVCKNQDELWKLTNSGQKIHMGIDDGTIESFIDQRGHTAYKCPHQGCKFSGDSGSLMIHYLSHTEEYPFECAKCKKRFRHLQKKDIHENKCDGVVKVQLIPTNHGPGPLCATMEMAWLLTFAASQINNAIALNQTGPRSIGKQWLCTYVDENGTKCSFFSSRKSNLLYHWFVHTLEKPFKCFKCADRFSQLENKNKHERKCDR
jgi:DNA-directed RNA polymerase subunit RPC12/RpoP